MQSNNANTTLQPTTAVALPRTSSTTNPPRLCAGPGSCTALWLQTATITQHHSSHTIGLTTHSQQPIQGGPVPSSVLMNIMAAVDASGSSRARELTRPSKHCGLRQHILQTRSTVPSRAASLVSAIDAPMRVLESVAPNSCTSRRTISSFAITFLYR